eukprot:GFYU01001299.1.p1 GENE.GFYU01001299.1~~GFYU01001299.1.p1  ORF type:complete len:161 (-),score=52.94 GFYU01001299.1:79-561(-)
MSDMLSDPTVYTAGAAVLLSVPGLVFAAHKYLFTSKSSQQKELNTKVFEAENSDEESSTEENEANSTKRNSSGAQKRLKRKQRKKEQEERTALQRQSQSDEVVDPVEEAKKKKQAKEDAKERKKKLKAVKKQVDATRGKSLMKAASFTVKQKTMQISQPR